MDTFINRIKELLVLDKYYQQAYQEGQLLVLYGKRRVGKTELVKHFGQNKTMVYYVAERTTPINQLETVKNTFADTLNDDVLRDITFSQWRPFFQYLGRALEKRVEPMILVFDEFPNLAQTDEGISSYFQIGWDEYLKNKKVFLVIMGSSIAMMYKHALSKSAPLYGRRTGQLRLEPFSYQETRRFYPQASFEQTFPLYAIAGGVPLYAELLDASKTLRQNITDHILPADQFLASEPELLLSDEFSYPHAYLSILKSIGLGRTKFARIIQDSGLPATALPGYLQTLIRLRLIKREIPITEKLPEKSKRTIYSLADPYLRFYFSFIFPHTSLIEGGNDELLFEKYGSILGRLLAKAYEDTTVEFIKQAIENDQLPHFEQFGRWWEKHTEIDLVGLNEAENTMLLVETKWSHQPVGTEVLNHLREKATRVAWGKPNRKEYFALAARSGFTKECIALAKRQGVVLIEQDRVVI